MEGFQPPGRGPPRGEAVLTRMYVETLLQF